MVACIGCGDPADAPTTSQEARTARCAPCLEREMAWEQKARAELLAPQPAADLDWTPGPVDPFELLANLHRVHFEYHTLLAAIKEDRHAED